MPNQILSTNLLNLEKSTKQNKQKNNKLEEDSNEKSSLFDRILNQVIINDENKQLEEPIKTKKNDFSEKVSKSNDKTEFTSESSLMDKMLQNIGDSKLKKNRSEPLNLNNDEKNSENVTFVNNKGSKSFNLNNNIQNDAKFHIAEVELEQESINQKQVIQANRYIYEQEKSKNIIEKNIQKNANLILTETKTNGTIEEKIQKAAKILDLNLKDVKIDENSNIDTHLESEQKKIDQLDQYVFKKSITALNRAFLNETQTSPETENKNELNKIVDIKTQMPGFEMKVDKSTIEVFTSKIIEAKQKVESFMSDIARQMYQNYKPPVTAFRINLNPANLGSIAIILKNNKSENSLNISMNINQSSTFEVINENKVSLQNAITKNFGHDLQFGLDLAFNNNEESKSSMYDIKEDEDDEQVILQNQEIVSMVQETDSQEYM